MNIKTIITSALLTLTSTFAIANDKPETRAWWWITCGVAIQEATELTDISNRFIERGIEDYIIFYGSPDGYNKYYETQWKSIVDFNSDLAIRQIALNCALNEHKYY